MKKKKCILIIDDELIILEALKIQLERLVGTDFIIESASCGEEAIELLEDFFKNDEHFHLVISDYNLDDMKGTKILAHALQLFPKIKKVIISGQLDEEDIINFDRTVGLDLRLGKPWNMGELLDLIDKIN